MIQVWTNTDRGGEADEHTFNLYPIADGWDIRSSSADAWCDTLQNKHLGSIEDYGDGYVIKIGKKKITLDYNDAQIILSLIAAASQSDTVELKETRTIKTI